MAKSNFVTPVTRVSSVHGSRDTIPLHVDSEVFARDFLVMNVCTSTASSRAVLASLSAIKLTLSGGKSSSHKSSASNKDVKHLDAIRRTLGRMFEHAEHIVLRLLLRRGPVRLVSLQDNTFVVTAAHWLHFVQDIFPIQGNLAEKLQSNTS